MSWQGWHVLVPMGWAFAFGFGCGGIHCALRWRKASIALQARYDEIFDKHKEGNPLP